MMDGVQMDAARRQAIKARCETATPGEWTCQPDADPPYWYIEDAQERLVGDWMKRHDAAFIAHARTDVPDLLAALDAVEADRAVLLDQLLDAQADAQNLTLASSKLRAALTRLLDKTDELDAFNPPNSGCAPEETVPALLESIIIETLLIASDARAALRRAAEAALSEENAA